MADGSSEFGSKVNIGRADLEAEIPGAKMGKKEKGGRMRKEESSAEMWREGEREREEMPLAKEGGGHARNINGPKVSVPPQELKRGLRNERILFSSPLCTV